MSESRYYRDNLADILEFTEGRHLLSLEDVRRFTGIKKYSTLKNRFPFNGLQNLRRHPGPESFGGVEMILQIIVLTAGAISLTNGLFWILDRLEGHR